MSLKIHAQDREHPRAVRIRSRLMLGAASVAAAVALAGCSAGTAEPSSSGAANDADAALYSAAQSEGSLTWYTSIDPVTAQNVAEAFEKAYPGIQVDVQRLTTGEVTARYSQEREAGTSAADAVTVGDPAFFASGIEKGWFTSEPDLANAKTWPSDYVDDGVFLISIIPLGITYNTGSVKTPPTSWKDLLDPAYANGRIQLGDPRNVPSYIQVLSLLQDTYGDDFLKSLAAQKPTIASSVTNATQAVASGAADILMTATKPTTEIVKAEGAPLEFVPMSPTVGVEMYHAVPTDAPHPNASELFNDYLLSEDGQIVVNVNTVSPLGDLSGTMPIPAEYKQISSADIDKNSILAVLGIQ